MWRTARFIGWGFGWTLLLAGFLTVGAAVLPSIFGMQSFVIDSGSMAPAPNAGDAIVVQPVSPDDLKVGDIVTYRPPTDPGRLVTHRVVTISRGEEGIFFVTKGDGSSDADIWVTPPQGVVGKVLYAIPMGGSILAFANSMTGKVLLVALPAVLILFGGSLQRGPLRKAPAPAPATLLPAEPVVGRTSGNLREQS